MKPPKTDAKIAANMARLLGRPARAPAEVIRGLAAELNVDVVILDPATMTPEEVWAVRHVAEFFTGRSPGWPRPSQPARGLRLVHSDRPR